MGKLVAILFFGFLSVQCSSLSSVRHEQASSGLNSKALVVATIHKGHLEDATYSMQAIKQVIENYQPDLVLVEIRPAPFKQDHLEDGPLEMTYATIVAREKGISVAAIDDWSNEDLERQLTKKESPQREELFKVEYEKIPKAPIAASTFETLHSKEKKAEHTRILNLRERVYGGNPEWAERQAWFHRNADLAIAENHPKRVLALVGYEHRTELENYLASIGLEIENPLNFAPRLSQIESCIPKGVISHWRDGISRLKNESSRQSTPVKERIQAKVDYFQTAVSLFQDRTCP